MDDPIRFVQKPAAIRNLETGEFEPIESYAVHPEDAQRLDDEIDAALAKAGLPSIQELKEAGL